MDDNTRFNNLHQALEYAITVIESYQRDIQNPKDCGIDFDLVAAGFCQGRAYLNAVKYINKIADGELEVEHIPA